MNENRKAYIREWKKRNKDKVAGYKRKAVEELSDAYLRSNIANKLKVKYNSEIITPELMQLYKLNILIKRKIKENGTK